jgi:hypothetical protein
MTFNPDKWATSLNDTLKEYVESVLDLDLYEIIFSHPSPGDIKKVPIPKTLISFEIDDADGPSFGFGDNVVDADYNDDTGEITEYEAGSRLVTFDVETWASIEAGGPTARLAAREDLDALFHGPSAFAACMAFTDGIEIIAFGGGRFMNDTINDVTVFRSVNTTLRVRVYTRVTKDPIPYVDEIIQQP